jgi:hypothetical protein
MESVQANTGDIAEHTTVLTNQDVFFKKVLLSSNIPDTKDTR